MDASRFRFDAFGSNSENVLVPQLVPRGSVPKIAAEFGCSRLEMLNAGDFDPVLDASAIRAYEIAEGLLFEKQA